MSFLRGWMEVFTGAGHRRRWSPEDKARIVAESYMGAESVCAVARRYGLDPTQLFHLATRRAEAVWTGADGADVRARRGRSGTGSAGPITGIEGIW